MAGHGRIGSPAGMVLALALAGRCGGAAAGLTLVSEGKPRAALVLPAQPAPDEELAAREIREHVLAISGTDLAVGTAAPPGLAPIRIGAALDPEAEARIRTKGGDPAAFRIRVASDPAEGVSIAGLCPEGTLFAAYELLERLGCRWYMPGEIGRILPAARTLVLDEGETVRVPSFRHRHLQAVDRRDPWYRRMRLGGLYLPSSHGLRIQADLAKEPDLFSLNGGKRTARQWCTSNPEVVRRTIEAASAHFRSNPDDPWIGLGPNDGRGFCECDRCRALDAGDWDPFAREISVTDRYVRFFNEVLAGIRDEFPDRKITFYAYSAYMRPPIREKPDPRLVPALAPITICRLHGPGEPVCPEGDYYGRLLEGWGRVSPEVFDRGYFFNLADPGFPFGKVHALRNQIPLAKRAGVKGWRVECLPAWGSHTPTLYVAAKLFWDAEADVDALLAEFYRRFFGSASDPMRRHLERIEAAYSGADHHTGASHCLPHIFPEAMRAASRADLAEAEALAGEGIVGRRVAIFRQTFDALDLFVRMLDARNAFRFNEARDLLDRLERILEMGAAHDPPVFNERAALPYLRRFWSASVRDGAERVSGKGALIAGLPDRWAFLIDPDRMGEDLGWFRADLAGGNWREIATRTSTWSDEGLRYYAGDAWYRARIRTPEGSQGRRVSIWFAGADERAKVWVNGELIGESPGRSFAPFELDATAAIRWGGESVIAVRVTNERLDELGTGGILGPVMLWSPRE